MTTIIGKITSRPFQKGPRTLFKFKVLDGQYKDMDITGQKIEVYGESINTIDPIQRKTILTLEGKFGKSRKQALPYFQIEKLTDLVNRVELDNVNTISKYLGLSISQENYNEAINELGAKNYTEASRMMVDPETRNRISEKYPAFEQLVYYISKEAQIIQVAKLFQASGSGLDISHAIEVCSELKYRADINKKNIDELIKTYPWVLTQVLDSEVADEAAEKIAQYANIPENQKVKARISSEIIRLLFERANRGDCFIFEPMLYGRLLKQGYTFDEINEALSSLDGAQNPSSCKVFASVIQAKKNMADIARDTGRDYSKDPNKDPKKFKAYYLPGIFFSEVASGKKLAQIISTPGEDINEKEIIAAASSKLNAEQKAFLKAVCRNKITNLTGEAGTGKSFALKELIDAYYQTTGKKPIVLAPTALASHELGEGTIGEDNSQTIHRYAHIYKQSDADLAIDNEHTYTPEYANEKLIIIDEGSMLGPVILRKLLETVNPEARIVFSGDPGQLPPVGAAGTFPSLLRLAAEGVKGIGHVHLQKNERMSDEVIKIANLVRNNYSNIPLQGEAIRLHTCSDKKIMQQLLDCIRKEGGYNNEMLILAPYRSKSKGDNTINVNTINGALSKEYGSGQKIGDTGYMVGDPVMAKRNDYADINLVKDRNLPRVIKDIHHERNQDVYNGMRGNITQYDEELGLIDYYTGLIGPRDYNINELSYYIEQSYCTTVHKAQGGQARKIFLVLPNAQNNRSLVYTGMTRCINGGTVDIITNSVFKILTNDVSAVMEQADNEMLAADQCLASLKYMTLKYLDNAKDKTAHVPFKSKKKKLA